jgi:hypothetical protein
MTKRIDPDILAIKRASKALRKSSSVLMLKANLHFLFGHCTSPEFIAMLNKQEKTQP